MITQVKIADGVYHLYLSQNDSYRNQEATFRAVNCKGESIDIVLNAKVPVEVHEEFTFYELKKFTTTSYFIDAEDNKLAVEEYHECLFHLTDGKCDEDYEFDDLENEFAYRKFIKRWKPISFNHLAASPVACAVEKVNTTFDTGSKWITPTYVYGGEPETFTFLQRSFAVNVAKSVVNELGIGFVEESKKHEKTCSCAHTDSRGLYFFKLAGNYILNDSHFEFSKIYRGTLKQCRDKEKETEELITKKITVCYNAEFGIIDERKSGALLGETLISLRNILSAVRKLDVKAKANFERSHLLGMINNNIRQIENFLDS